MTMYCNLKAVSSLAHSPPMNCVWCRQGGREKDPQLAQQERALKKKRKHKLSAEEKAAKREWVWCWEVGVWLSYRVL